MIKKQQTEEQFKTMIGGQALIEGKEEITGYVDGKPIQLYMKGLNETEIQILLDGCLMNYYKNHK